MLPVLNGSNWLPDVFNDFFDTDFMKRTSATAPAINVKETEKAYVVELAAPGMKKEDFDVNIDNSGNLCIKMEKSDNHEDENKKEHYLRREFAYSKFQQTLLLPDDVDKDKISAHVDNGVLTVDLPKVEQTVAQNGRSIEIG